MKDKRYRTFNHAKTRIKYHLIFSTKYRKNVLEPIRDEVLQTMKSAEEANKNFKIDIMEIDKNHIHFLISIKPCESISNVVKYLKQYSTYYIWKNNHDYMTKFYYKKHYLWTRGYFICTIGECTDERIQEYIKNQG